MGDTYCEHNPSSLQSLPFGRFQLKTTWNLAQTFDHSLLQLGHHSALELVAILDKSPAMNRNAYIFVWNASFAAELTKGVPGTWSIEI